jgi:HlyD family secretion protein
MNRRNIIALAVVAAAAAGAAAWALRPAPVAAEVAVVSREPFEQVVSDDGKTRVRDRYVVSTPLAGRLDRIRLHAGDTVEAGQAVAILAPSAPAFLDERTERELTARVGAAEAQQLRARAEVQRADAQLGQARADRNRSAKLASGGFLSAAAGEQAELVLRTAEKSLEAARFVERAAGHDVEQARASLVRYRAESAVGGTGIAARPRWEVRSPVRGAVLRVLQESEGVVAAGTPLVEIADPRNLEAVVDVLSQEAVNLKPGMAARIRLGGGAPALPATVRNVEPAAFTKVSALGVEEQRVNVVLDFLAPIDAAQSRQLTVGDAFRIEVEIVVFRTPDAITVPLGALFRSGPHWSAWAVEGDRARLRGVTTTRRNGSMAMVDEGLKAGDTVLLYPPDAVKEGSRIKPTARPASTDAPSVAAKAPATDTATPGKAAATRSDPATTRTH